MKENEKDFLRKLTEAAKKYGWQGDYEEVTAFVIALHEMIGEPIPDLTPFEEECEKNE